VEMTVADLIGFLILLLFPIIAVVELIRPARRFPKVPRWHAIGIGLFVYVALLSVAVVSPMPMEWLAAHSLLDLSGLGLVPGILVGHLLLTLVMYGWHRATHTFDVLWRGFHQIHHSPRHLNVYVAGVNHPLDLSLYIALPYFVGILGLGLSPIQATMLSNIAAFNAFLQHANINTPRWLALFFQRPEAHCIHHQRGVHGYNYSDLPLWDWVFGTFRNPATWEGETGFDPPADQRYGAMLAFVDVNRPDLGKGSFGQKAGETT
jgi:sterol desaturase/sphingolipid hydroxylase (fatty acid hydroxylase superfamily)